MLSSPNKIFPADGAQKYLGDDLLESPTNMVTKTKPPLNRAISPTDMESPSQRYRNTLSLSSFGSAGSNPSYSSVEVLINYLTTNMDNIGKDRQYLRKFEELTSEVLSSSHDPELHRIIKAHGWTGSRFRAAEEIAFEAQACLQDFSNWYLKHKVSSYTTHISNLFGLGDSKGADQILSFCPDTLISFLRDNPEKLEYGKEVRSFSFRGACMLADISGFSKFSGAMCSKGVSGLDDLREATNGFLGHFVKIVYEFDGDVVAFAGDALICVFLEKQTKSDEVKEGDDPNSSDCCFRALQCACVLRNHQAKSLSTHLAVSYGEMKFALLGGHHDQWVYLMNGACVSELSGCINDAGPMQVAATKECYQHALKPFQDGSSGVKNVSIEVKTCPDSTNYLIESVTVSKLFQERSESKISALARRSFSMMNLARQASRHVDIRTDPQVLIETAALFVPRPILTAVYSESLDHIGELRQVTTMFLSLDSYSSSVHQDPASLQPFFLLAQEILHESGGYLRQFLVDDKGCVLIAMWGMPSFTYANNCSRALYCAASIKMKAPSLNHSCSVGVTTGNIYCGSVGAPERRDYAGIGNEVNMAARLMAKAKGRVLVDKSTHQNLNQTTRDLLEQAEEMVLKGAELPLRPFEYKSSTVPQLSSLDDQSSYNVILRRQVKNILVNQLDKLANVGVASSNPHEPKQAYFTIILGLPGTGKSTAADYFKVGARKRNIQVLMIQARPGHEGEPYGLMRELFLELIGEDNFETESQQRSIINHLIDQAYPDATDEEKSNARVSVELVLGVEWSEVFTGKNGGPKRKLSLTNNQVSSTMTIPSTTPSSTKSDQYKSKDDQDVGADPAGLKGMFLDSSLTLCRKVGDMAYYKIMAILLKNTPTAVIIEDAHFCDELSWVELHLLLLGKDLNIAVLVTMRSNTNAKPNVIGGSSRDHMGTESVKTPSRKKSVLLLENSVNLNGVMSPPIGSPMSGGGGDSDSVSKYGLKFQTSAAYLSILGHENTACVEMSSLSEAEVRDVLMHTLAVDSVSNELAKLVLDVSSGNAFWCKSIASFIKERGVKELEKAIEQGDSRQNSLKVLILLRMEKLSMDQQLVLKHSSIIGDEFSERMLHAVVPERLRSNLSESLELLAEHGFIECIEEYPIAIFGFQNELIRQTLYELIPPSDSAHIHLGVAEFIEMEYVKNLRPFYSILSHHFKNSHGKRASAFKYKVKAADYAISRGAFSDGLVFVQAASQLAFSRAELRVLLDVISRALHDINPTTKLTHSIRRIGKSFGGTGELENNRRVSAYMQLKVNTEAALEKISSGQTSQKESPAGGSVSDEGSGKNRLLVNRQPSAKLNWQPSYVASKMDDLDDEESKQSCNCTVS